MKIEGVQLDDIPDDHTILEVVLLAKCLDSEGNTVLHERWSYALSPWEALGMGITFADGLRRTLLTMGEDL